MAKRKRHRVVDPAKARVAGGGSFYDRIVPTTRAACSRCGTYSTLLGADRECLRCRLERRNMERRNAAQAVKEGPSPA
jgi:hypothetical protein